MIDLSQLRCVWSSVEIQKDNRGTGGMQIDRGEDFEVGEMVIGLPY